MREDIKSIKEDIIDIYQRGGIKADAARFIQAETGLGWTQSREWAKRIYDECRVFGSADEDSSEDTDLSESGEKINSDLEFSDDYVYNKENDSYIFLLEKRFGKNLILKGDVVKNLIKNYSNYDGNPDSINQVSIRYGIPRNFLVYILKTLGVTHDSLPFTPEDYQERDSDELLNEYISGKRFALNQRIQKEEWKTTKDDARKWNEFVLGKYNPFVDAIETWEPPVIPEISNVNKDNQVNDKVFLCVLTDTHIGELTKTSWEGKQFNTKKAVANILSYINQINEKVNERKTTPNTCKLLILGDILNSCVDGMTRKGTKLHNDIVNGDMFKIGLDVVITIVSSLAQIFNKVDISCVNGNHDGFMVGAVYYSASRYFEGNERVVWNISDYWLDSFKINNTFFVYSHGKDDVNHVALPNSANKFESFVQSLLLRRVEDLVGVKSKYFISGHLHSYEHVEFNDFEKIRVPSTVTADGFAEALGFMTKARQNCFIVGQNAIEDTMHFFFE